APNRSTTCDPASATYSCPGAVSATPRGSPNAPLGVLVTQPTHSPAGLNSLTTRRSASATSRSPVVSSRATALTLPSSSSLPRRAPWGGLDPVSFLSRAPAAETSNPTPVALPATYPPPDDPLTATPFGSSILPFVSVRTGSPSAASSRPA